MVSNWEKLKKERNIVHKRRHKPVQNQKSRSQKDANLALDTIIAAAVKNAANVAKEEIEEAFEGSAKSTQRVENAKEIVAGVASQGPPASNGNTQGTKTLRSTKEVAIDCEMVGVGADGTESMLARCSVVNAYGDLLFDTYVAPSEAVTDYRTAVSGIEPKHLNSSAAISFRDVQKKVSQLIDGKLLIGHALENDLKILLLSHPRKFVRDTQTFRPFRSLAKGRKPKLSMLVKEELGMAIQEGSHSSVEDARATMALYQKHKRAWEKSLRSKGGQGVRPKHVKKDRQVLIKK
eukprot:Clim_evm25s221 gene=Clim_evmTU25s221